MGSDIGTRQRSWRIASWAATLLAPMATVWFLAGAAHGTRFGGWILIVAGCLHAFCCVAHLAADRSTGTALLAAHGVSMWCLLAAAVAWLTSRPLLFAEVPLLSIDDCLQLTGGALVANAIAWLVRLWELVMTEVATQERGARVRQVSIKPKSGSP